MPEQKDKSLDDQLKEAELERILVERQKIELERRELERKINRPWYKPHHPFRAIFQAAIAGLLAVPLIWFFFQQIIMPLSKMENYELIDKINSAKRADTIMRDSLQTVSTRLDLLQKELEDKEQLFAQRNNAFQKIVNELKRMTTIGQTAQQAEEIIATIDNLKIKAFLSSIFGNLDDPVLYADVLEKHNMIMANDYYDKRLNSEGTGIANKFKLRVINGNSVRGPTIVAPREFTASAFRNIVLDSATGLTWQQSGSQECISFWQAQEYIQRLNEQKFAGFNDWRLPALEDAMSLMEPAKSKANQYVDPIFDNRQQTIWTADKGIAGRAWYVDFRDGDCLDVQFGSCIHVRAVR